MLFGSVGWQRARIGLCSQLKVKKWNHFDQWNIVPLYHLDCCVCVGILSFMFGFSYELLLLRERYDSWILSSNIFKAIGIFFTIGISRYIFQIWRLIVLFLGALYEPNPTGPKSFAFIHTSDWLWSGSFAKKKESLPKNSQKNYPHIFPLPVLCVVIKIGNGSSVTDRHTDKQTNYVRNCRLKT